MRQCILSFSGMGDKIDVQSVCVRSQKKILGSMTSNFRFVQMIIIDETTNRFLDNLFQLARWHRDKRAAEKLVKNTVKLVVKWSILLRNGQFDQEEMKEAENFRRKLRAVSMTVVSFREVEFTYDRAFLISSLVDCRAILRQLLKRHLTEKSIAKVDDVFKFFTDATLLDAVFRSPRSYDIELQNVVDRVVGDLKAMIEVNIV